MQLEQLPGVGIEQLTRMQAAGIGSCRQLLRAGQKRGKLSHLAKTTGLPHEEIRSLVQAAELSQIRGIGPTTLAHLWEVGVDSLENLAGQEPEPLQMQLQQVAARSPNLAVIENWILQARQQKGRRTATLLQPGFVP
ncbi:DUF4332 domain-containing protein [Chloroflexota bacterium]